MIAKSLNDKEIKNKPLLSIIVPVYNVEKYLEQCINSLLNQTIKNIEIIIIDDGSTDNSSIICDYFAKQDKRVKVLHNKNSGYGNACNIGIAMIKSEYFAIIESDDFVEYSMFERLLNEAMKHDLEVVRCHYYFYNTSLNTNERSVLPFIPKNKIITPKDYSNIYNQPNAVWAMLYKLKFIKENNIKFLETPGASYQDISFVYKVFTCSIKFMLIDDALIHYRIDNINSSINSKEKIFCICNEYMEIERFTKERNLYDEMKYIIAVMKFKGYTQNYRRLNKKNKLTFLRKFAKEMNKHIKQKEIIIKNLSRKDFIKIYIVAFMYPLYHLLYYVKRLALIENQI